MDVQLSVLVVEDEPFIADDICSKLQELNYRVAGHATSGEEGLQLALKLKPDIVLLDIHLDGELDGIETAHLIQQQLQIVVIYLTNLADRHTFARARKSQPDAYLPKPFNAAGLQQTIELARDRHQGLRPVHRHFPEVIFIRAGNAHIKVTVESILCVKAERAYSHVVMCDGEQYLQSVPMNAMVQRIGSPDLVQIHKSCTLNLRHVTSVSGNELMVGAQAFQLGKKFSAQVKKRLGL